MIRERKHYIDERGGKEDEAGEGRDLVGKEKKEMKKDSG